MLTPRGSNLVPNRGPADRDWTPAIVRRPAEWYWWVVLTCAVLFLWRPQPSSTIGLILSIPHWPIRVLRWTGVGSFLDAVAIPVSDSILHVIGDHPWIQCFILIGLAAIPWVLSISKRLGLASAILGACAALIFYPLVSAFWSGMFLQSALSSWQGGQLSSGHWSALVYVTFGLEPMTEEAPERAMQRIARISGDSRLTSRASVQSNVDLVNQQLYIEQTFAAVSRMALEKHRPEAVAIALSLETLIRMQMTLMVPLAAQGSGGDPAQPWRELRFEGPLGPILLRTNFLPGTVPWTAQLLGGEGRETAISRIKQAESLPADMQAQLAQIDTLAKDYSPNDELVQMWYTTLGHFFEVREFLRSFARSAHGLQLASKDSYGQLIINLHNSCESYRQATGGAADVAGSGIYLESHNEIHLWSDEKEDNRNMARIMLSQMAKVGKDMKDATNEELAKAGLSEPPSRLEVVMPHELTHWMVHAMLGDTGWGRNLPPAFAEGLALNVDEVDRSELAKIAQQLNVQAEASAAHNRGCPSAQRLVNWSCAWSRSSGLGTTITPAQLLVLRREELNASDSAVVLQNYADSWALVHLFGENIFSQLQGPFDTIPQAAGRVDVLTTPWAMFKTYVKRDHDLQQRLSINLDSCEDAGVLN